MSSSKPNPIVALFRSPFLWGGLVAVAFYYALFNGHLQHPLAYRYFAAHPILMVTACMFFFGIASQLICLIEQQLQRGYTRQITLGPVPEGGQPVADASRLLDEMNLLTGGEQRSWFGQRLAAALEFVRRKQTAEALDEELKYLSDTDYDRRQASHALVKVIIWSVPILGFLGTVIGLTEAIANLSPDALEKSLSAVTAGLGVSFDTTALSLALSMVLMFGQFAVERIERGVLDGIDKKMRSELISRFEVTSNTHADPVLEGVQKMAETVLQASIRMVEQQAELWHATLHEGEKHWTGIAQQSQAQIEQALTKTLSESLKVHAQAITASELQLAEQQHRHWEQVQRGLVACAEAMTKQQGELRRQGDVLLQVVEATGQVTRLEEVLNRNLALVASTRKFEETLHSLSAAIHLFTGKLGGDEHTRQVTLNRPRPEGQAA